MCIDMCINMPVDMTCSAANVSALAVTESRFLRAAGLVAGGGMIPASCSWSIDLRLPIADASSTDARFCFIDGECPACLMGSLILSLMASLILDRRSD